MLLNNECSFSVLTDSMSHSTITVNMMAWETVLGCLTIALHIHDIVIN